MCMKKLCTADVVKRCQSVHGNKYDYHKVDYKDSTTKIIITCPIHGEFRQFIHDHLKGCGCAKCSGVSKITPKEFIERANETHNNKYGYNKVEYKNYETKVEITCPIHGIFSQTPHQHLNGKGCFKCGNILSSKSHSLTNEEFILRSKSIHNEKYEYISKYKNQLETIIIKCPIHGEFKQKPKNHLNGCGCPLCKESKGEKYIRIFLSENNISFIPQYRFIDCKDIRPLPFDFYLPDFNLCIEYDGRHHFIPIKRWGGEIELKNIQYRDLLKNEYCVKNKIKLLRFKFNQDMKQIKEEIRIEIRSSEGGEDSKLLVNEMRDIYIKTAKNNNLD